MKEIVFKYKDRYTNGKWNTQSCVLESVEQCIKLYGLGVDCEYEIISIKDLGEEDNEEARKELLKTKKLKGLKPSYVIYDEDSKRGS